MDIICGHAGGCVGWPWMHATLVELLCAYVTLSCCAVHSSHVYGLVCLSVYFAVSVACVGIWYIWLDVWVCAHVCYCLVQCIAVMRMSCSGTVSVALVGWCPHVVPAGMCLSVSACVQL